MSVSIILSIGRYGGFYITNGDAMKRICFGWVALTLIIPEFDETFYDIMMTAGVDLT